MGVARERRNKGHRHTYTDLLGPKYLQREIGLKKREIVTVPSFLCPGTETETGQSEVKRKKMELDKPTKVLPTKHYPIQRRKGEKQRQQ